MARKFENINITTQRRGIPQYFANSTVFITGASGFLGQLLVEKLLRTCPDIKRIYILMRPKKDKNWEKRFQEYFDKIIFDRLKQENPKSLQKVFAMSGDCGYPGLGIAEKDMQILYSEVNCVFHVAATVRFDEKLKTAAYINVRGASEILKLAKRMVNLTSIVYVSTAYSFCPHKMIDEKFYQPKMTGKQLMLLVENCNEKMLDELKPLLLGEWPNTYVFTKSIAEDIIKKEGANLPLAIVRPSIVVATAKEPIPGWIDNIYGATGIIAGAAVGLIRTLHCKPNNLADLVPADYVINSLLAAAWQAAATNTFYFGAFNKDVRTFKSNIPIYNYVCSPQKPFTWKECTDLGFQVDKVFPSNRQIWYPYILLIPNKHLQLLLHYMLHLVPAHITDFFAVCWRTKPRLVKAYKKISKFMNVIAFFSTQEWTFGNKNTQELWERLNCDDKNTFNFDMGALNWRTYFDTYIPGVRQHVLNDSIDTLPQALSKAFKLKMAHYVLVTGLSFGFFMLLLQLFKSIF